MLRVQSSSVSRAKDTVFLTKQRSGITKWFFNGLGCFNESNVPAGKNHRRFGYFDLKNLLDDGDPLTDLGNYLLPGYRPVVEMPFTMGEETVYFYGVVFGYRERTDDDNLMTEDGG